MTTSTVSSLPRNSRSSPSFIPSISSSHSFGTSLPPWEHSGFIPSDLLNHFHKHNLMRLLLLVALLGTTSATADEARYVTVVAGPGETSVFEVTDSTTIQLVSLLPSAQASGGYIDYRAEVRITKGKFRSWLLPGAIIQGPFTLTLKGTETPISAACTLRLIPEVFPPDKTVVIPPGQGAQITLQCSSNLVDWVTATNGIYTTAPSMKFFRIHSEKVP